MTTAITLIGIKPIFWLIFAGDFARGTQFWLMSCYAAIGWELFRRTLPGHPKEWHFRRAALNPPEITALIAYTILVGMMPWAEYYASGASNMLLIIGILLVVHQYSGDENRLMMSLQYGMVLSAGLIVSVAIALLGFDGLSSRTDGLVELGPNSIAISAALGLLAGASLVSTCGTRSGKVLMLTFCALFAVTVVATFSKTTLLGLCIAVITSLFFAHRMRDTKRSLLPLTIVIVLFGALWVLQENLATQISDYGASDSALTASGRTLLWSALIDQLSPLQIVFGAGYGASRDFSETAGYLAFGVTGVTQAHNALLESVVNTGAIGTSIFLYVIITCFNRARRAPLMYGARITPNNQNFSLAVLTLLVSRGLSEGSIAQANTYESVLVLVLAYIFGNRVSAQQPFRKGR